MSKIKQILRCYMLGMGIKSISSMLCVSRNTVRRYVRICQESGIPIEKVLSMSDDHIQNLFFSPFERPVPHSQRWDEMEELLPVYSKRLKTPNVTRKSLYEEYIAEHPDGYNYASFCRHLRRYNTQIRVVGHVEHKAGEQMYVDYAGDKLHVTDEDTGEEKNVEVFVAILPCSQYIFCEAVASQRKDDFIRACEDALHFFGGAPMAIVPDNLKAAVTSPNRYEPIINSDFESFAEYYGCVVYPARVRKPKDKAHVENAVKIVYRSIYAQLKGNTYHSLVALNTDIRKALNELNNRALTGRNQSRREMFEDVEKDYLRPLPETRFFMKQHKVATVMRNSYVSLYKHHYSVPKEYIGQKVELVFDSDTVEIYCGLKFVTSHKRDDTPFGYSQKASHNLPGRPGSYEKDLQELFLKAKSIDPNLENYLKMVAQEKNYPVQAFKSCRGILSLSKKYGEDRLVDACNFAALGNGYSYNDVYDILRAGKDVEMRQEDEDLAGLKSPRHKNIRGREYFDSANQNNNTNTKEQ